MFNGIFPAIVTPFRNDAIDEDALRAHVEWLLESGVHGIVPCGTTGEAGALSPKEYSQVVCATVDQVKGRVPVVAGAGANVTTKAIEFSKFCQECGVDGLLHVTPYYNKPTQAGLLAHFSAIAKAVPLPTVLYNVPGRTGVNMENDTVQRLASISNIVGLKDASGDLEQSRQLKQLVPHDFWLCSGDDALNASRYELGYQGAISVTANIAPAQCAAVWQAAQQEDYASAKSLQDALAPVNDALFIESNPIPVKTALSMMGRCTAEFRLPLCNMSTENEATLKSTLSTAGIL